jgi:hypothetical protein
MTTPADIARPADESNDDGQKLSGPFSSTDLAAKKRRKTDPEENAAFLSEHLDATLPRKDEQTAREAAPAIVSTGTAEATPPAEINRQLRDQPTVDAVVDLDEEKLDKFCKNFQDLFKKQIDGENFYIDVIRRKPASWQGITTKGSQHRIERPMTIEEFAQLYGGEEYVLQVYGKSKRGPVLKDVNGKLIGIARTTPVIVNIPGRDPNPYTAVGYAEHGSDDMTNPSIPLVTAPMARVRDSELKHEEVMDERRDQREQRADERRRRELDKVREEERGKMDVSLQILMKQMDEKSAQIATLTKKLEDRGEDRKADMQGIAAVISATRPAHDPQESKTLQELQNKLSEQHKDEIKTLMASHATELKAVQDLQVKLSEQHTAEITRLREGYAAELTRLREEQGKELRRVDELRAEQRKDSDKAIKESEERMAQRIKDVEERARQDVAAARADVADAKSDGDRRVNDIKDRFEDRIKDLDRNHKREIDGSRERWELQLSNEKTALETRLAIKDQEILRLQEELETAREEAKKPLTDRINEVAAAAEALGYGKNEPEQKDWKQMALEVGGNLVSNLPELLRSAGDTITKMRQQPTPQQMVAYTQAQQAQMQTAAGARAVQLAGTALPPPLRGPAGALAGPRGGFATEDGPEFEGARGMRSPIMPADASVPTMGRVPAPQPPTAPAPRAAMPYAMQQHVQPMQPARMPVQPMQPVQPAPVAAAVPQPAEPPAPTEAPASEPGQPGTLRFTNEQVLEFRPLFEAALKQGASPTEVADYLVRTYNRERVAKVLPFIEPGYLLNVLQENGFDRSPLCRRDGQKFLRETYAVLQQRCAG